MNNPVRVWWNMAITSIDMTPQTSSIDMVPISRNYGVPYRRMRKPAIVGATVEMVTPERKMKVDMP